MEYRAKAIPKLLGKFPNAQISIAPTPIYKLPRLSSHLGHHIYIMRDDLTGFAIGGNKVRKLDYLIGDAVAKKSDTIIATYANNFTRNAAAVGKVYGFEVHIILTGDESKQNGASQALFRQFETVLHYVPENDEETLTAKYDDVINGLKKQGKNVYELPPGGSNSIGALGYINAFDQIVHYSQRTGVHFHKIIHSTGSTGTQAGLILGQCISQYEVRIIGTAVSQKADNQYKRIYDLTSSTARMLGIQFDESKIVVEDRFIGPGYAIPSIKGKEAAKMFATMEGILLDDVYTGKAAAGLIDYARNDMFDAKENILFVHTGGNVGLYY